MPSFETCLQCPSQNSTEPWQSHNMGNIFRVCINSILSVILGVTIAMLHISCTNCSVYPSSLYWDEWVGLVNLYNLCVKHLHWGWAWDIRIHDDKFTWTSLTIKKRVGFLKLLQELNFLRVEGIAEKANRNFTFLILVYSQPNCCFLLVTWVFFFSENESHF